MVLRVTHTIQECIKDVGRHGELLEHISKGREMYSMQTFDQHLIQMVKAKVISLEEAKKAASKPTELDRNLMLE